ncbi:MAG: hypothetical protein JSS70_05865 [Bacteroidetes bacterium]|nr:hypothetical protein [Bacteroidota bacterium]
MLEQIADLVKEYGQDTVVNNSAIPNSQNNAVLAEATHSITGGLQSMLAGGGLQDILSLFTGGGGNNQQSSGGIAGLLKNPAVAMMIGNLVNSLVSKFNMNPAQANSVSSSLIPNVLNGLITRTTSNDPANDAFDLNDLIGSLTGGNVATKESAGGGFDFQGLLNQFTGGGNGGGGFNIQDIINQVTQGAQQHQQKQSAGGGGITDLIKGFFN